MNLSTLKIKKLLPILGLFLFFGKGQAQDIHASMFNRAPFNLNPGLIGVFGGDLRAVANYRKQWKNVPVDYMTFTAGIEHKFNRTQSNKGYFTGGLHFNYDNAGDLSLTQTEIGLTGSYVLPLTKSVVNKHFLSGGLQLGFNRRSFDDNNLRVDVQFNGKTYDPSLPTQEGQFQENINYPNFSGGLNYRYQNFDEEDEKRTRLDLGVAIYHLNNPEKNFASRSDINLEKRYTLYGITSFQVRPKWDIGALAMGQFQGPHAVQVIGANTRFYFREFTALLIGLSYRTGDRDALIFNGNLDYRNFSFGASYDWNLSDFDVATNGRGGPEFSVIYTLGKPKPIVKPCLIF